MHGGEGIFMWYFFWKDKERYNLGEKSRWENSVKINLKELGCNIVGWINVAHDSDQW
jgi:hypothetical protein